jgi:hypothetical protein
MGGIPLYLATYFDRNYLARGVVMLESLRANTTDFTLFVLCLDDAVRDYFLQRSERFPEVRLIELQELEREDHELHQSKGSRSLIEFYFTLSPCLPRYLLKKHGLPHICTLDADLLFVSSPRSLFQHLVDHSIIITPHGFPPGLEALSRFGRFNVGFQIFRNDETGNACLDSWRAQCLDWCRDFYDADNDRYADQKYLDAWPSRYPGKVRVLQDDGSGVAPWNLDVNRLEWSRGSWSVNGRPLVYYHFHHFKILSERWAVSGLSAYGVTPGPAVGRLYGTYWTLLRRMNRELCQNVDHSIRQSGPAGLLQAVLVAPGAYFRWSEGGVLHFNPSHLRRGLLGLRRLAHA